MIARFFLSKQELWAEHLVHYIMENGKPDKKFVELKQLTGEFQFVDKIGSDTHCIYIPILEVEESTLLFPS